MPSVRLSAMASFAGLTKIGPLVALTQYVLALAKRDDTPADASRAMREDVRRWLKDLERIDGDRRERYREIGEWLRYALRSSHTASAHDL